MYGQDEHTWVCMDCGEYWTSFKYAKKADAMVAYSKDTLDRDSRFPGAYWLHFNKYGG